MPDTPTTDTPSPFEPRHLPVVVPASETAAGSWLKRVIRALFGWQPESIRSGLRDVLETEEATGFSPLERTMLRNILTLRERRIGDVRVPRADIVAVQQDIQLGELIRVFEKAEHSRLVVFNDTLDDPIGMVHIRDLIAFMTARAAEGAAKPSKRKKPLPAGLDMKAIDLAVPLSSTKIVREILFTPPSMRCIDLLARMQTTRIHLALVVDEYGGTEGLISIEDIVEQIVGDIADEHDDDDAASIVQQPDGSYIGDARTSLEDVIRVIGPDFDPGDTADDVDTLGGYLTARAGRVPVRGEIVPGPGKFEIEVLDADPRRVKRAQIFRLTDRRTRVREPRRRDNEPGGASPAAANDDTAPPTSASPSKNGPS
jgi:CBS domain containing-hemolysin-like protein